MSAFGPKIRRTLQTSTIFSKILFYWHFLPSKICLIGQNEFQLQRGTDSDNHERILLQGPEQHWPDGAEQA